MILRSPRRELAERIRSWGLVPAVYDGSIIEGDPKSLEVYEAPPGGVDPPAVILAPGTPYFARTSFDGGEWRIVIALIVARYDDLADVGVVEDWWTSLWAALEDEIPIGIAQQLSPVGAVVIGGNKYLFSQTDFTVQQ